jgi:hypothetical protein
MRALRTIVRNARECLSRCRSTRCGALPSVLGCVCVHTLPGFPSVFGVVLPAGAHTTGHGMGFTGKELQWRLQCANPSCPLSTIWIRIAVLSTGPQPPAGVCQLLQDLGCHEVQKMWRRSCPVHGHQCIGSAASGHSAHVFVELSVLPSVPLSWGLPTELAPQSGNNLLPDRVDDWEQYHQWRGIPLSSPIGTLVGWQAGMLLPR